jgi:hypothetical protein
MVFFMLNQCRILYFTIIKRENSLHVTGCIGVKEILPNRRVETFPITCNGVFRVISVEYSILQ